MKQLAMTSFLAASFISGGCMQGGESGELRGIDKDIAQAAYAVEAGDTTDIPAVAQASAYVTEPSKSAAAEGFQVLAAGDPVIRSYRDSVPWFGENRDNASLLHIGKVLGEDYFLHPIASAQGSIPDDTAVVLFPSNGKGLGSATAAQNNPNLQANLETFLARGGALIVSMGDNDSSGGYRAPGAIGTPSAVFPDDCANATLAAGALGPDGVLGTDDDHPIVKGPDGTAGTGDDLNHSNIDMISSCSVAHGHLASGITLPEDATILATANFGGVQQPIMAEYCHEGGRVILDTFTKEFTAHQGPLGTGSNRPTFLMINLFSYALSGDASCGEPGQPEIVIDNHDEHQDIPAEISLTGDWAKASQATEQFGRTGLFAATGGGFDSYRFTPEFTGSGDYRVMVWNNCFSPRANNVPHTIVFDGGSATVEVDQDCNTGSHGEWLTLGVFPFAAGTDGFVEISDAGLAPDSFIGVDAVRFVRDDVVVIDNDEPGTSFTGQWSEAVSASEHHGLNSLFARGTDPASYRFTPTLASAGNYEVFVWNSCFSPREQEVPHTIAHSDGFTTVLVDQNCTTGSHGEFLSLGVYAFPAGARGFVEISNDGTATFGNVGADAALFVPAR